MAPASDAAAEAAPSLSGAPSPASRETTGRSAVALSPASGRPSHGAAVAATMISMPITSSISVAGPPAGTPRNTETLPPVALTPEQAAGAFRETLWFKKGDVDQMVADARAKVQAMVDAKKTATATAATATIAPSADASGPSPVPPEDPQALAERYTDDGTLTVADHKKFSVGSTGNSGRVVASRGEEVPGERMSDNEVLNEIGGGKRLAIIGIAGVVVMALVGVLVMAFRGKPHPAEVAPALNAPATVAAPEKPAAPPEPEKKAAPAEAEGAEAPPVPKPVVKHRPVAKKKPALAKGAPAKPAPAKAAPAKKHPDKTR
jgi:hypothetical protein